MLPLSLIPIIGTNGVNRWNAIIASLPATRIYHGTSLARAEAIIENGFRTYSGRIVEDEKVSTYWGSARVAANFAYRNAALNGCPPAILSARLQDVLASGVPMALRTDCDDCDIAYSGWLECYDNTGSLFVKGGRYVKNLTLHSIV